MNVKSYTTAKETGQRLEFSGSHVFEDFEAISEHEVILSINPTVRFQTFMGIGGAFTDASAINFNKLSKNRQSELLTAYFDVEKGNAYRFGRTHIHSCDFSVESYTYIDEGDSDLKSFSVDVDKTFKIPFIKKAFEVAGAPIPLIASPWSAPAFMKTNRSMLEGGSLLAEYQKVWALYFTKFIKAYEAEGIPIWGITIQNEPAAVQRWESMTYSAEQERDFLKYFLGPTMWEEGLSDVNIIIWDHNRDLAAHWGNTIFSDREASKYAWGIGFHWYETWAGGDSMQCNLAALSESFPNKHLVFTEGCQEGFNYDRLNDWSFAERYGEAMIRDFNVGSVAWCDWNLLLDHDGGPNHVGNYCFSPIHADLKRDELIYLPSYYYIGHFSRFIALGSRRVGASTNRSDILITAFLSSENKVSVVVMNKQEKEVASKMIVGEKQLKIKLPANSIQTINFKYPF
jgi:glucosylceramidase